jgi:hypothetical protein
MTEVARKLYKALFDQHKRHCQILRSAPETLTDGMVRSCLIFYGILCKKAKVSVPPIGIGRYLDEIGAYCEDNGYPLLNALAVTKKSQKPGQGYDNAHGGNLGQWKRQVRDCIAFKDYPDKARNE